MLKVQVLRGVCWQFDCRSGWVQRRIVVSPVEVASGYRSIVVSPVEVASGYRSSV